MSEQEYETPCEDENTGAEPEELSDEDLENVAGGWAGDDGGGGNGEGTGGGTGGG